jgi:acetylserotonin N-methyltransferase
VGNAEPILNLIDGFRHSKILFAAVQLGIFDGKRPEGAAVSRLMDACVSLGLLLKSGSEYANTPAADEFLASESPASLAGYIRYYRTVGYRLWDHLEQSVSDGKPAPANSDFEQTRADFILGMCGTGKLCSPYIAEAFDLSQFKKFVDLGGANGHLALAVKNKYPQMTVVVFELPVVVALTRRLFGDRMEFVAGDFNTDDLPPADLYGLGRVLHNQPDNKALTLLSRIYKAAPREGGVLIAERLLADDRTGPVAAHVQDLHMLVSTGGKERTLREYEDLLHQAGFRDVRARITGRTLDAIIGIR